jgi:CPA2 family monovalent cation:H+ antiporter-2
MDHSNLAIVLMLTIGLGLASLLAYFARLLKLPSILGYLLAGFIIGPYSPGFVADHQISEQLAELGVILMLFGVGLHFKLQDLINVQSIAIPGATVQTLLATLATTFIVYYLNGTINSGIILGLSVGVASTVVLVRVLTDNHLLNTKEGHIAIGWLVVEDIFTVIILILLPTFATFARGAEFSIASVTWIIALVIIKILILSYFMFTWGHKIVNYILIKVARFRSQELFTLSLLALMFAIAVGSTYLFGTSIALGAFIAGMVIGKTTVRHQAAANALSLKDIFAVVFFLSVLEPSG